MAYLLVGFTLLIIVLVFLGVLALGRDRLIPGRNPLLFLTQDGIAIEADRDMPILLPDGARPEDYRAVKFATSALGYNKAEVDELLLRLVQENEDLRARLAGSAD